MSEPTSPIQLLIEKVETLGTASIELLKLQTVKKSTKIVTNLVWGLVVLMAFSFIYTLLNIGVAMYLGKLLNNNYLGFFATAGIQMILFMVLYFGFKNRFAIRLQQYLISKFLD